MKKELKVLFLVNAVFNGIGAVILFFGTGILNSLTGMNGESNFLWHLLGACSLSLAVLSAFAIRFKEKTAISAALATFLTFNLISALVSVTLIFNGTNRYIAVNTTMHLILVIFFVIFGIRFMKEYKRIAQAEEKPEALKEK